MKQTDYRVIHWHVGGTDTYAIYQVYYDELCNIHHIADKPVNLECKTPEELKDLHFHIANAYLQPVVEGHLFRSELQPKISDTLNYLQNHFK